MVLSGDIGEPGNLDDNVAHVVDQPSQAVPCERDSLLDGFRIAWGYGGTGRGTPPIVDLGVYEMAPRRINLPMIGRGF